MADNKANWVLEETKTAALGDARLNRRFGNLLEMLIRKPMESIPGVSKGWSETKAAYRFFDHKAVTWETILQPHEDAVVERMRQEAVVLLPQDTTELDYTNKLQTKGLGKLCYERQQGLYLHPTLAVTPQRICLGIVNGQILIRESLGKNQRQEELPIEEKESLRWLESYRMAQALAERLPETKLVSISDREGDIYEIFVEASRARGSHQVHWIIRGNQDRCLVTKADKEKHEKLIGKVKQSEVLGMIEFDLPRAPDRKARRIRQEIRAQKVCLKPPYRKGQKLAEVEINVVIATEIDAPKGVKPIEWILLTSLPMDTCEQSLQVIEWYLCRWQIEIFFKILKAGCQVEELQLQTLDRLKPCLALYMIIAWRILYLTMFARQFPEMPCNILFEDEEWKTVYMVTYQRPAPQIPPSLNQMMRMIASLGGFLNRKHDTHPGPQTLWSGLQRVRDFIIGIEALNACNNTYG